MRKPKQRNLSDLTKQTAENILWHAYTYLDHKNQTGVSTETMRFIRQIIREHFEND